MDPGTTELAKRHTLKVERGVGVVRVRNVDSSPLDKLLHTGKLTPEQYCVLDDLTADMFRAGLVKLKARPLWQVMGSGSGVNGEDPQAELALEVAATLRYLSMRVGQHAVTVLYDLASRNQTLDHHGFLEYLRIMADLLASRSDRGRHHQR